MIQTNDTSTTRKRSINSFNIRTWIARSIGKSNRYACEAIRIVPAKDKGTVVLEATDGRRAVCLLTKGNVSESRLVPTQVLPSRQLHHDATIHLIDGHWRSTEGKIAEDMSADSSFPSIADVLPAMYKRSYYETANQSARRRRASADVESVHVVLGLEVDLLQRVADSLGTGKVTLMVPVPIKSRGTPPDQVYVDKPIAVCPAVNVGDVNGIGVVMPLKPVNANEFYGRVRQAVFDAERRLKHQVQHRSSAQRRTHQPEPTTSNQPT